MLNNKILIDFKKLLSLRPVILLAVVFFPLILRLFFLKQIEHDPSFVMPIIDSLEFDAWGYQIAHGQLLWDTLQNHPPLYAYFLGLIYKLFGYNPLYVAVVQYLLFSVSTLILFLITEKLVNKTAAFISVILMSCYWFLLYITSFIFSENLSILLNLLTIYVLLFQRENVFKYFLVGNLLGLSAACRPDMLFFTAILSIWLIFKRPMKLQNIFHALIVIICVVMILAPIFVRNHMISGEIMLRTQVGANLYTGNLPSYQGTNLKIQVGKEWQDFISMPYQEYKRPFTESEANQYFFKKTFEYVIHNPVSWIKLLAAKAYALCLGKEFLRTEDVYVYTQYVMQAPYMFITTNMIFVLAVIGFILFLHRWKDMLMIYFLVFGGIGIYIFFPIKTRYLMCFMPGIILFASIAVNQLIEMVRGSQIRGFLICLASIVLLYAASFLNPLGLKQTDISETLYAIAKNYESRNQHEMAIKYFQGALSINPGNSAAYNDLAIIFMNQKQYSLAIDYFNKAYQLDPTDHHVQENIKMCKNLMLSSDARTLYSN